MQILLLGANGLLGRHICAHLRQQGHDVLAGVRNPATATRRFSGIKTLPIELTRMTRPGDWLPHLRGVDAVIKCIGILQSSHGQPATTIHVAAPIALFDACREAAVKRVIQISAVSADAAAGTEYALTKKAADDHLRSLDLAWVVVRPSLVYAQGSFGGTSALRGLAGLPAITPLVGDGDQRFQPIHATDLAAAVSRCLHDPALARCTIDAVGPEILSMRQILILLRAWLDLPPAKIVKVPLALVRLAAKIGDVLGTGPLRSTAIDQLVYGNISDAGKFEELVGFRPRSLTQSLQASPSHVQDRWHARLYWLGPVLTATLAAVWLGSGIASLGGFANAKSLAIGLGIQPVFAGAITLAFAGLDIAMGVAVIFNRISWLGIAQLCIVLGYTCVLSFLMPSLWANPLGPLLKNLPILAIIAVWMAMRDDK